LHVVWRRRSNERRYKLLRKELTKEEWTCWIHQE